MGNASNTLRESTVDFLDGMNDSYVALYILDSAASHLPADDPASDFLLAHHSLLASEYDARLRLQDTRVREDAESAHGEAIVIAHTAGYAYSVWDAVTGQPFATYHFRKLRKAIKDDMRWALELAEHFTPGNIIFSDYWRQHDLVLTFYPPTHATAWSVDVVACYPNGQPKPGERARNHCTFPDRRDKITHPIRLAA
jgi:hypothetical protein